MKKKSQCFIAASAALGRIEPAAAFKETPPVLAGRTSNGQLQRRRTNLEVRAVSVGSRASRCPTRCPVLLYLHSLADGALMEHLDAQFDLSDFDGAEERLWKI